MKKILLNILFCISSICVTADTLDNLLYQLKIVKYDTSKVRVLNKISKYYYNINVDSSEMFANKALELSRKIKFKYGEANSLTNVSNALYYKGEYKVSIQKIQEALNIYENLNCVKELIDSYISIGQAWKELGNNPKSLDNLLLALKASEKIKDDNRIGKSMISMGVLFLEQKKYDEALSYSKNALLHIVKTNNIAQEANAYARIGNVFGDTNNPIYNTDSVLYYYKKSLELFTKIDHKRGIAVIYNNIAGIYLDQEEPDKAIEYFQKAYEIRSKLGDQNGLTIIFNNFGNCYKMKKMYSDAIKYYNKSIFISLKIGKTGITIDNYGALSNCYALLGKYEQALNYKNLYVDFKDSLYNDNNSRLIEEMQTKYETDKKEKEIEILNKNKTLNALNFQHQKEKLQSQKYFIYGSIIVIIIVLSLSFFLFRLYINKKAVNKKLNEQNVEIFQQKEEIVTQRDEIEAQINVVTYQKEQIEKIHEEVTSSIRYAQLIQKAVLPSSEQLNKIAKDYFVLYKPCNIVSGDFYWVNKIKEWNLLCVADCTGHGVPGAFMSMLGISFLNEIIRKDEAENPAEVLNHLREFMVSSLKQNEEDSNNNSTSLRMKDGMDISLIAYNSESLILHFAGAYNSCYIIRKPKVESDKVESCKAESEKPESNDFMTLKTFELYELKGDKMPISIHQRMDNFTLKEFQLTKGDFIYLFSDGFVDQFGGPNRKKFLSHNFKNTLKSISHLSAVQQKIELERVYNDWQNGNNQVDDITIVGIRV